MNTRKNNFVEYFVLTGLFLATMLIFCLIGHYAETKPSATVMGDRPYTVILDAGHGGEDGGASSSDRVFEKDLNLTIVMNIGTYLEQCGVKVIYTRTEDILLYDRNENYQGRKKILDLAARLKIARECDNAVFVSIHMNAFPQKQYHGLQVYYSPHHPLSQSLAQVIQENVRADLDPHNQRKIKKADSSIYLLDRLDKPAVLVECGFLSNEEEAEKLADEEYQKQLSLILAKSIIDSID